MSLLSRALVGATLLVVGACAPTTSSEPLPHHAWVWQRAWTPSVHGAVGAHLDGTAGGTSALLDGLGVLTHEVSWSAGEPVVYAVDTPPLPPEVVRTVRVAVPPEGTDLPAVLSPVFEEVCAAGPVQLDLDLPTRRLPEYAAWRRDLSRSCELRITALPTWLGHPSFPAVAHGGYVLQLHWFDPTDPLGDLLVDDPEATIDRAAREGIPFEIALPAYGHRVWMRGDTFVRVDSEDAPHRPHDAVGHTVLADPQRVRDLLDAFEAEHPAVLRGIWWFRLPVPGDRLAWSSDTLGAVLDDRLLARTTRVVQPHPSGSLVCVRNAGTLPWIPEPVVLEARPRRTGPRHGWTWSLARRAFLPPDTAPVLQSGESVCPGWISQEILDAP